MVSFQTPFPEAEAELLNQRNIISEPKTNSKKRKSHDAEAEDILTYRHSKATKSFSDIQLHLETPLPSEWQRCLDIQSGEIHFYNTTTHKRTWRDPRASPQPSRSSPRDWGHMSLDLELNLPCSSPTSEKPNPAKINKTNSSTISATRLFMGATAGKNSSIEITEVDQSMEMVTTVCMRCHMLVMLCKSSPACPNCKFMHPPYQTTADLFKPTLSLSC